VDKPGFFRSFGDVLEDVHPVYWRDEIARVKFVGANPRNDLRLEGTFAAVEKQVGTEYTRLEESDDIDGKGELRVRNGGTRSDEGTWERVLDDEDWELIYEWKRISTVWGTSEVVISWEIPNDVESGRYRIRYFGDAKSLGGEISSFEGVSGVFTIV
jgi:neutral ceramidase